MNNNFIAPHHPNLNDRKQKQKGFTRWLIRHHMSKHLTNTAIQDQQLWERRLHLKRLSITSLNAILILMRAKGTLNGWKYRCLQRRFLPFVNKSMNIALSSFLHLGIPYITFSVAKIVTKAFQQFLHRTSLSKPVNIILLLLHNLPPKLLCSLTHDRITISLLEAQSLVHRSKEPNSVLTSPQIYHQLKCPTLKPLQQASLGTFTAPHSDIPHRDMAVQLQDLRHAIPKCAPFRFANFAHTVHQVMNQCLRPPHVVLIPGQEVNTFFCLSQDSVPIRVDKYPLLFDVSTVITFMCLFIHVFNNATIYKRVRTLSSASTTRDTLLVYHYLYAKMFPFVMRNVSHMRQRNALCVHIPTIEGCCSSTTQTSYALLTPAS